MYARILVPLDGSSASEQSIPMALSIAGRTGAQVELVIVVPPGAPEYIVADDPPDARATAAERRVPHDRYIAERVAAARSTGVSGRVLEGDVAETLQVHVRDSDVELIVMTTHGRGGLSRAWLGSVAEQMVRDAQVPVLVRRPQEPGTSATSVSLNRILVPVDGSAVSETILDRIAPLAAAFRAQVELVRVLEPEIVRARVLTAPAIEVDEEDLARQAERADVYLGGLCDRLRAAGVTATPRLVAHHQPARAILSAARESGADLIAMATRGHGGLRRLMMGSVADKVLRAAEGPLFLYRPPA